MTLERLGRIAVLCIANPPVNALSPQVVAGMVAAFDDFESDPSMAILVVHGEGSTFGAGGDITSLNADDFSTLPLNRLLARVSNATRPIVAVLQGAVLGGSLEVAMACHYRVAIAGARFAMPEVKLGLIPGSLGTQRLPRLVGVQLALDLMTSGRIVDSATAIEAGIVDAVRVGDARAVGIAYAEELLLQNAAPRSVDATAAKTAGLPEDWADKALADARKKRFYPAFEAVVHSVKAAATLPFAEGERIEAEAFDRLRHSAASRAMRHLFLAERQVAKIPGLPKDVLLRPIRQVGIVGAGTMGGGIAMNFANAGIPVLIVEATPQALERGLGLVRKNYEASAAKGKLSAEQLTQRLALLTGSLDYAALGDCDLVVEAVFEDMKLKEQVCTRLGQVCKPGAIIATNTSTLNVDVLARATGRPADVVGLHFFSPANVMRLLEVVRGEKTAPDVLATVMKMATTIGKVAVVSGVCYGFIGNRMAEVYMREAEFLLMEGAEPQQIDRAVEALGLAMGPCRMLDMAGIDVGAKTVIERGKASGLPKDSAYRVVCRKMFELGRFGQKTLAGYYRYEGRTPVPDPETTRICAALAEAHGITRRNNIADQEIVERLLYPLINEGVLILQEGIAYRPGDIDVVWVAGYGFPDHRGGPLFMADEIGLAKIVERLAHYSATRGNLFGYWTPVPLLAELAAQGRRLDNHTPD
ncbi:3-hydroxyacyl-CoA dehydrogenase NAD-binding domain-containing protein [Caballeronia sp. 15711]|uniref:3-hydroxyacyl-CoA dehydrogenase NAD-binding domain-containing protein n=1 Tax=Caballeronia sp. 15711 TaxID=3391029 RepID=UPI0039E6F1A7